MKVVAMYLPQFHEIEENNKWWGDGFTEWTTVRKATPLFEGHIQPKIPLNDNYYDLLEKKTMQWQADLMKRFKIDGLCFYHYWFKEGKRVLERPAENLLRWKDINIPFCFSWANETWARSWSNVRKKNVWANTFEKEKKDEDSGILLEQQYGNEQQWKDHFLYLLPFFQDSRYIRIGDKPVFLIYQSAMVTCLADMREKWNGWAKENGISGIYFIGENSDGVVDNALDALMLHEPQNAMQSLVEEGNDNIGCIKFDYEQVWREALSEINHSKRKVLFGGFVNYDDSPRRGGAGRIIVGGTPQKFQHFLSMLLAKNEAAGNEITFINAWNEWGEGMYLEPDIQAEYKYLEAVSIAKDNYKEHLCEYDSKEERLEDQVIENKIEKIMKISNRRSRYIQILDRWLSLKEQGKSVALYLQEQRIESIAIYGMGMLGMHLIKELEDSSIVIKYGIDKLASAINVDLKMYTLNDTLEKVDVVIVTVFYAYDIIADSLHKMRLSTLSLEDVILEMG